MQKLICFDLDGVLVDACEWHRIAFNQALEEFSINSIPIDKHYKIYNGLPTVKKLELLGITDNTLVKLINKRKQEITIQLISKLTLDLEKTKLLKKLKKSNFLIACVTNSIRETTEIMLKNTGQFQYFDLIITNQDVKNPKPNSEGYIKAMVLAKCLPENTWIVEDSPKGITAAMNTGANVIQVKNASEVTLETIFKCINL